jgi:hypothetical protein
VRHSTESIKDWNLVAVRCTIVLISELPYSRGMVCCTSDGLAQREEKKKKTKKYIYKTKKYIIIKHILQKI